MKTFFSFSLILFGISIAFAQQSQKKWTLEECVNYAIQNNLDVKQNEFSKELKQVDLKSAKDDFLPSVTGSTSAYYDFGTPNSPNTFSNSLGISSNATLYNGNRRKNTLEMSSKDLEISELAVEKLKSDLSVQVVSAYLNVLYNQEGVKIAQEQVLVSQKLLNRMQELVSSGVNAKNDLYQLQATLASNEENLVSAQNNLDLALLDLSQLLQISNVGFDIADVSITIDEAKLKYDNSDLIYNKALEWRPEIFSAQKQIENADLAIVNAKAGLLPTVTASYSFGTNYYDVQNAISQSGYFKQLADNRGHSVGLSASVPIFDKYATKNSTQRAQIQKLMAENDLENQKITLRADIEKAYIDAKTSLKTFEASKKSVEAQQEAFRVAQEKYNIGILTSYDFEQVRNQLVQAQSNFIKAKYNFIFKSKFLEIYYGLPVTL